MYILENVWELSNCKDGINKAFEDCEAFLKKDAKELLNENVHEIELEISSVDQIEIKCVNDRKIKISIAVFRELEAFYKVAFSEENETFYQMVTIASLNNYDEKVANRYRDLMIEISIKILLFHELGHIYNGHIQYCHENDKEIYIDFFENEEVRFKNVSNEIDINDIIKAFEWNAEDFSATRIIARYCSEEVYESINKNCKRKIILSNWHMWFLIFNSTVILYTLLGIGKKDRKFEFKHEPLRLRHIDTIMTQREVYKKLNDQFLGFYGDVLLNQMIKVEKWVNDYCSITKKREYSIENNLEELNEERCKVHEHIEEIYLNSINEILKPYAIFKPVSKND